ncbi:hypothetical protein [Modestobacter marinus]|uniref:hypothetical protein n=1 Tax=Modestobacter marinus TaxID=477641 RepID=UPI001C95F7B6|nr:hypothetical protein [Modestobacter marinus]
MTTTRRPDRWRPAALVRPRRTSLPGRPHGLALIRAVHTAAWASVESGVGYLLWSGARGRSDRRAGVAAAVVVGECLVFAANGCRCPLTDLAERAGAASGSVTDIYLPRWFARNLPVIHVPLLVLIGALHHRARRVTRWPGPEPVPAAHRPTAPPPAGR